jgi:hypothetical protein
VLFYNDFLAFPYRPTSDDIRHRFVKVFANGRNRNLMLAEGVPSIGAGKVANRDVRHRSLWPVLARYVGTSAVNWRETVKIQYALPLAVAIGLGRPLFLWLAPRKLLPPFARAIPIRRRATFFQ